MLPNSLWLHFLEDVRLTIALMPLVHLFSCWFLSIPFETSLIPISSAFYLFLTAHCEIPGWVCHWARRCCLCCHPAVLPPIFFLFWPCHSHCCSIDATGVPKCPNLYVCDPFLDKCMFQISCSWLTIHMKTICLFSFLPFCYPFVTNTSSQSLCDPFAWCRWSTSHCEISGWGMQEYNNTASYPDSVRAARIEVFDHTLIHMILSGCYVMLIHMMM